MYHIIILHLESIVNSLRNCDLTPWLVANKLSNVTNIILARNLQLMMSIENLWQVKLKNCMQDQRLKIPVAIRLAVLM